MGTTELLKNIARKLASADAVSVIAFADSAQQLLPGDRRVDRGKMERTIDKIEECGVDIAKRKARLDDALEMALSWFQPGKAATINHVVALTTADVIVTAEKKCRNLASQYAERGIGITLFVVGEQGNRFLIDDLAKLTGGDCYFLDSKDGSGFLAAANWIDRVHTIDFINGELFFQPMKGVELDHLWQLQPRGSGHSNRFEIAPLPVSADDAGRLVARVRALSRNQEKRFLVKMTLPKRPDGRYIALDIGFTCDGRNGLQRASYSLPVVYSSKGVPVLNAEPAKHVENLEIGELNRQIQEAAGRNDFPDLIRCLDQLIAKCSSIGHRAANLMPLAHRIRTGLVQGGGRIFLKDDMAALDIAAELP